MIYGIQYQGSTVGRIDENGQLIEGNLLLRELFAGFKDLGLWHFEGIPEEHDEQITEGTIVDQTQTLENVKNYLQPFGFTVVEDTQEDAK